MIVRQIVSTVILIALCMGIFYITLSERIASAQSESSNSDQGAGAPYDIETILAIVTLAVGSGGVVSLIYGIKEYRDNRILNRQEILLARIKEFEKSKKMKLGKAL